MKCDISVIIATIRPTGMNRVLHYIEQQSINGLTFEVVIIQESDSKHDKFNVDTKLPINNIVIKRQNVHNDYGAAARDVGILEASGEYLVFWDDDNIYYQHALASQYCTAYGFDIGIVRTKHQNIIIPSSNKITAGDIDTMCICVKKEMAVREKWSNSCGRYSDYRWLSKLLNHKPTINYSKIVIGHHL